MKDPYRNMESKTVTKPSLYERLLSFAEEMGVKRQLLLTCGAVVMTYLFVKIPYWFGQLVGTWLCGADYWKPDLDGAGNPKLLDYSLVSWMTGFFVLLIMWGGYLVSSLIFKKKD